MKLFFILVISFFCQQNLFSQINNDLIQLLDSMTLEDQKWRNIYTQVKNKEIDSISLSKSKDLFLKTDSSNFLLLKDIFESYGFLGFDQVGKDGSHSFWLLVQHADNHTEFQEKVLTKMKIEALKDNANFKDYAYLVDRVKVNTGKLQVYGTQMQLNADSTSFEPLPVIEAEKLNKRRKKAKLSRIEFYIRTMNNLFYGDLKK